MPGEQYSIGLQGETPRSATLQQNLLIAAVNTENQPNRATVRQLVRDALCELLAKQLGCQATEICLQSIPGQAIRLDRPQTAIGLSVSHETGLSVLAIHLTGPVGIDLLRTTEAPFRADEIPQLARDYLGPEIARQIAALPLEMQTASFAQAWTRLESRLKCLNQGLQEWRPALEQALNQCACFGLQLPSGFVGTLAVPLAIDASRNA
jgi:4'-phosphopantetheinyl transferase